MHATRDTLVFNDIIALIFSEEYEVRCSSLSSFLQPSDFPPFSSQYFLRQRNCNYVTGARVRLCDRLCHQQDPEELRHSSDLLPARWLRLDLGQLSAFVFTTPHSDQTTLSQPLFKATENSFSDGNEATLWKEPPISIWWRGKNRNNFTLTDHLPETNTEVKNTNNFTLKTPSLSLMPRITTGTTLH
jgi:hypothetical protein